MQLESLRLGRSLALHEEDLSLLYLLPRLTSLRAQLQRPEGYDANMAPLASLARLRACDLTLWGLRFDQTVPLVRGGGSASGGRARRGGDRDAVFIISFILLPGGRLLAVAPTPRPAPPRRAAPAGGSGAA